MGKLKTIIASALAAVVVGGAACFLWQDGGSDDSSILRAVPSDASIVITTSKLQQICSSLNSSNEIWRQLLATGALRKLTSTVNTIDTALSGSPDLMGMAYARKIAISLQKEGKDKITALMATEADKRQFDRFGSAIQKIAQSRGYAMQSEKYDGTKIFAISDKKTKECLLTFAYSKGVLMASDSKLTTENAILQVHNGQSIAKSPSLKELLKTRSAADGSAQIIVNYGNLGGIVSSELKPLTDSPAKKTARMSDWGLMDMSLQDRSVTLAGYSCSLQAQGTYMKMLEGQSPVGSSFASSLPSKTASFISLGISNIKAFRDSYAAFLKENAMYGDYKAAAGAISKSSGIDAEMIIYEAIGERITEFRCDHSIAGRGRDEYIVADLKDEERMADFMKAWCKKSGYKESTVKTATNKKFTIYQIPEKNLISLFFSDLFTCETSHFAIYSGKAVFGRNGQSILEYMNSMEVGMPLSESLNFKEFREYASSKSNLFLYADVAYCGNEIRGVLNSANSQKWQQSESKLKNLRGAAFQISCQKGSAAYTNAALIFSNIMETDRLLAWKAPTDSTIISKPLVVKNHNSNQPEVLAIDSKYRMYLFDSNGKKLFAKQLPGPPMGQIAQIDYYGNGKLQYLLATDNQLHLIDRNGNYVENYPIALPAKLSAGISVFDYDGNGEYRIFAPCANRKVYLYGKDGQRNEQWAPAETREPVITPVQFFRIGQNDYLVFSDNLKTYVLNRRGEIRINVTDNYSKSQNSLFFADTAGGARNARLVTTTSSGDVVYISMNGSCKTKRFRNCTARHNFLLCDIDSDGQGEYIFTDGEQMEVFGSDGALKFRQHMDGELGRPGIFRFSASDIRIGVPCPSQNKIYLYSGKGDLCRGFPLEGATEFSICRLNSAEKYSVIAGCKNNFLLNYNLH